MKLIEVFRDEDGCSNEVWLSDGRYSRIKYSEDLRHGHLFLFDASTGAGGERCLKVETAGRYYVRRRAMEEIALWARSLPSGGESREGWSRWVLYAAIGAVLALGAALGSLVTSIL